MTMNTELYYVYLLIRYREELEALKASDTGRRPLNWQLSPQAVRTFILGSDRPIPGKKGDVEITRKYYGNDMLVERCIVTLAGNRGLMLVGEPGTAKTMLSELLSAGHQRRQHQHDPGDSRNYGGYD